MRCLFKIFVLSIILSAHAFAADEAARPWRDLIPDPDTFDWTSNNRPGYRYRGMLPLHQKFHDYIQEKKQQGKTLSWADGLMIRRLQATRRWPEAPVPNEYWKAYLRYLREQPGRELNVAHRLMYSEAMAHGIMPMDHVLDENMRKAVQYLNSDSFRARNWFERCFGRVEPWMEYYIATSGVDLSPPSGPSSGLFPPTGDFNGLRIKYNITGVKLLESRDTEGFITKRNYTGTVSPGTITFSGTCSLDKGHDAKVRVYLRFGRELIDEKFNFKSPGSKDFSYTINIPPGTDLSWPPCQLFVEINGRYSTAGAGSTQVGRGLQVAARFEEAKSAKEERQKMEDEAWRLEVERTLKALGYTEYQPGKLATSMDTALNSGDETWNQWVDDQQTELAAREDTTEAALDRLLEALKGGDGSWRQYIDRETDGTSPTPDNSTAQNPTRDTSPPAKANQPRNEIKGGKPASTSSQRPPEGTPPTALPDMGGLKIGDVFSDGVTSGHADHFPQASQLIGGVSYKNVKIGTIATGVWTRDGIEIARNENPLNKNQGWLGFRVYTDDDKGLTPGRYTLTITIGSTLSGRKTVTVGK